MLPDGVPDAQLQLVVVLDQLPNVVEDLPVCQYVSIYAIDGRQKTDLVELPGRRIQHQLGGDGDAAGVG